MRSLLRTSSIAAFVAIVITGLCAISASAATGPSPTPQGEWLTENGNGVIQIGPCGEALCGRIVGLERGRGEPVPLDVDGRPQCGLTIISNEKPASPGTWLGWLTDPRDGSSYHAKLWLDSQGDLRMRVFIGIPALGATQVWRPFTGHVTPECRLA